MVWEFRKVQIFFKMFFWRQILIKICFIYFKKIKGKSWTLETSVLMNIFLTSWMKTKKTRSLLFRKFYFDHFCFDHFYFDHFCFELFATKPPLDGDAKQSADRSKPTLKKKNLNDLRLFVCLFLPLFSCLLKKRCSFITITCRIK